MKKIKIFSAASAVILSMLLILTGCNKSGIANTESGASYEADTLLNLDTSDMFTNRDFETGYDESTAQKITLSDSNPKVNITKAGTYVLSGSISDGSIIIEVPDTDKVQIVLDGVSVTSKTSAALYIKSGDKVFVTSLKGEENTLSNGGLFAATDENNIDGAVFSKTDITFNGDGTLNINSPAAHGIVGKDDVKFTSGTYKINCASHGVDANDSIRVANAAITAVSGKDGLHCENVDDADKGFIYLQSGSISITAQGDGISSSSTVQIDGGAVTVTSGGGSGNASKTRSEFYGGFGRKVNPYAESDSDSTSMKGIKANGNLIVNECAAAIDSADDALHSNASVTVNGGTFTIRAGDDGIHADNALKITGGILTVEKSYEGVEAKEITVTGGTVNVTASDDGFNAAGGNDQSQSMGPRGGDAFTSQSGVALTVTGGEITVNASGDGLDSNGDLKVTGGTVTVSGPENNGNGALDYNGNAVITGGTLLALGSSGMAQNFTGAENQASCLIGFDTQNAGSVFKVLDGSGKELITFTSPKSYSCAVISSPDTVSGKTYTVTVDGKTVSTFSVSSAIFSSGVTGGMGGKMPDGMQGNRGGDMPSDTLTSPTPPQNNTGKTVPQKPGDSSDGFSIKSPQDKRSNSNGGAQTRPEQPNKTA